MREREIGIGGYVMGMDKWVGGSCSIYYELKFIFVLKKVRVIYLRIFSRMTKLSLHYQMQILFLPIKCIVLNLIWFKLI